VLPLPCVSTANIVPCCSSFSATIHGPSHSSECDGDLALGTFETPWKLSDITVLPPHIVAGYNTGPQGTRKSSVYQDVSSPVLSLSISMSMYIISLPLRTRPDG
jgi:hypothetical protein